MLTADRDKKIFLNNYDSIVMPSHIRWRWVYIFATYNGPNSNITIDNLGVL